MSEKILYNSEGFELFKWYPMPIHGEVFNLPNDGKTDVPTEWLIFRLKDVVTGDIYSINFEGDLTYFRAKELCDAHNKVVDELQSLNK